MSDNVQSPKIEDLSWGETVTAEGTFKDAKLWPGGVREWDWGETSTDHTPGIQPADVKELLENGAEIIILSRGQSERLQVMDKTVSFIEKEGAEVEIHTTEKAVKRYNELAEKSEPVGALIHSTC